ncbi:MAG: phosphate transport regulator [Nocardioides sp.]|nr:phosphate transport regulator [Nocardioides sp.]
MRLSLRRFDAGFADLFTASAAHLVTGASLLAEALGEGVDLDDVRARMGAAEHLADETRHEIVRRATQTFVTPFDREDVYRLASALDDAMDVMTAVVDLIGLYDAPALPPELSEQVELLQRCAELTHAAMPAVTTPRSLREYWIEVNRLENAGDQNHRRCLAALLSGRFNTLEMMKLKDIAGSLENAIDRFEVVADVIETIAVKEG